MQDAKNKYKNRVTIIIINILRNCNLSITIPAAFTALSKKLKSYQKIQITGLG